MKRSFQIKSFTFALLAAAILSFSACEQAAPPSASSNPDAQLQVAVSILPQKYLVERIAGDKAGVQVLIPEGASPATYQPTDYEVTQAMNNNVYFKIGVPFERGPWMKSMQQSDLAIIDSRIGLTMRTVPQLYGEAATTETTNTDPTCACCVPGAKDPHVWLSIKNLKQQTETYRRELTKIAPEHEAFFQANADAVTTELEQVQDALTKELAPLKGKAMFVFHPAWGYFTDEWGMTQIPIEVAGNDPTDAQLTQLFGLVKEHKPQVIFVQPQVHSRAANIVAQQANAKVVEVDPLHENVIENLRDVARTIAAAYTAETK